MRVETSIYDEYERDADRYLATYGLRVSVELLPMVRQILTRETEHETDTYAAAGTVLTFCVR